MKAIEDLVERVLCCARDEVAHAVIVASGWGRSQLELLLAVKVG